MRIFLILFWCVINPLAAVELPDLGSSADRVLSPAQEQEIAQNLMRQLRREMQVIEDVEIHNYITALGQKLVTNSNMAQQPFQFIVVNNGGINAFAVPGGLIAVYSGLILHTQSESELASVVAHEIAHVTQRHIARRLEAMQDLQPLAIATTLLGLVLGAVTGNPAIIEATSAIGIAGSMQANITYTHINEQEADRVGIDLLAKSGFEARDMPNFFQRLHEQNRFNSQVPEFLRTHPVTTKRATEARDRANKYPVATPKDDINYHLVRAKLLVLSTDKSARQLAEQLENMLQQGRYRSEIALRYAIALAWLENLQADKAATHINWLQNNDIDRVSYRILQARLAALSGEAEVERIYDQAIKLYPLDAQLTLAFSEYLLQQGKPQKAKELLLKISPPVIYYHRLLAQAFADLQQLTESYLHLAEYYYLSGEIKLALEQLKQARRQPFDYYLAARIEARYGKLNAELREMERNN
jgi:beta-barrel assembly-enhancing protease